MKISNFKFQINFSTFEKLLFYAIILFLPTQFGKHFWPDFSFVNGIRIDYLSPTIYLTDIFILLLFLTLLISQIKSLKNVKFQISNFKFPILGIGNYLTLVVLVLFLLLNVLLAKKIELGAYGLIKLGEFMFFGFYTARFLKTYKQFFAIIIFFAVGIIGESALAILQYINQSSLNGLFYSLGERTFTSQTPGIANASLDGQLLLRPYGTFSHPNVLAAYLLVGLILTVSSIKYYVSSIKKTLLYSLIGFSSVALFLTMSRVAILLWTTILIVHLLKKIYFSLLTSNFSLKNFSSLISHLSFKKKIISLLSISFIILFFLLSPIHFRFSDLNIMDESITKRQELIIQSFQVIKNNPIVGVGLNNYLINAAPLLDRNTFYLQPVHNIYLLILAQTGMIGFSFFLWLLYRTIKHLSSFNSHLSTCLLVSVLVLGMFDHYFLTLQQGQLLLSFVFGFLWSGTRHAELDSASRAKRDP